MPAKSKRSQSSDKLNKTLQNYGQRIGKLEKQVALLSKSQAVSRETGQKTVFESPAKRRYGWGLIWIGIFLYLAPWLGFGWLGYILPYGISGTLTLALLIAGIILVLRNPKLAVKATVKKEKETDLGVEEQGLIPDLASEEEKPEPQPSKKKSAKVQGAKQITKVETEAKSDFESDIGKKWLPKIGIISIVLGVAFFVIYAIQNKWIGPTGQVSLGVFAGIVLVIAGEVFDKRGYHNYAMTLVGGGFAIMYFAMFAAYRFYSLLPLVADIIALSVIILSAIYFSVRYNSIIIAAEAFLLGYIVPLLTSSVNTFFLIYTILLTIGLVALTYFRNWGLLGAGGMTAMYITHLFWLDNYTAANESFLHIIFIFIYFIIFAVMALNIREGNKDLDSWLNRKSLITSIFLITYLFIFKVDLSNVFNVIFPLVLLLVLLAFFVLKYKWDYFALGGILMTYILHWTWLGSNFRESSIFINFVALSIYFVLLNILLFMLRDKENRVGNVVGILVNSAFYYGLNAWPGFHFEVGYKGLLSAMLSVFYLISAYLAYQKKASHYFNTFIVLCFGYLTLTIPLQFNQEWITISWSVLTLILVVLGFRLRENVIRISSSIVAGITLSKVLFLDSIKLTPVDFSNILNSTRLFAYLSVIIIFYIIAHLYYKNKDIFADYEHYGRHINAAYAIAATLLVTLIIGLEIWDTNMALNAKKLWTSLAFILQAIVVLSFGFSSKIKLFRLMGLLLFGLAILKVFIYDLSNLETGYRIISFIVLGIIALLGAFLYNKYKEYL